MFTMFVASSFSQVSIAVGLAGFACVLLLVLFVLINKYGRRSKFGMKGKTLTLAHGQTDIFIYLFTFTSLHHRVDLFFPLISTELLFYCNRFTSFSCFTESHSSLILLPRVIFFFFFTLFPTCGAHGRVLPKGTQLQLSIQMHLYRQGRSILQDRVHANEVFAQSVHLVHSLWLPCRRHV